MAHQGVELLQSHIEAFKKREKGPGKLVRQSAALDEVPKFLNGRTLRDYQVNSTQAAFPACLCPRRCR